MLLNRSEHELAKARALAGALAIADRVGWEDEQTHALLPPAFRSFRYVASSELLLVPSGEPTRADLALIDRGMRLARAEALVVRASIAGRLTLYCAVGEWRREGNVWHHDLMLWLSSGGAPWLVPDPAVDAETVTTFQLTPGRLRPADQPPAYDGGDARAGRDRADAFLAAVWGDR